MFALALFPYCCSYVSLFFICVCLSREVVVKDVILFLEGKSADYVITGAWSAKAAKEVKYHVVFISSIGEGCKVHPEPAFIYCQKCAYICNRARLYVTEQFFGFTLWFCLSRFPRKIFVSVVLCGHQALSYFSNMIRVQEDK